MIFLWIGGDVADLAGAAQVRDAYEILSSPETKIIYDTGGMEALQEHKKGQARDARIRTVAAAYYFFFSIFSFPLFSNHSDIRLYA